MNRIKKAAGGLYAWVWYHSEVWLSPEGRRPFTFILRDIYHQTPLLTVILISALAYCIGRWWLPVSLPIFLLTFLSVLIGSLLGHLFWGQVWKPGEQEHPTYNPHKKMTSP